jgi:uncharacterized membrane protein YbhN (UPF0104 family)
MRRILLSALKILISAALLYFALRKINFYDLASRFDVASLGWIGLAIAVTFLQIFLGALRWRVISTDCGAPLATTQAFRFNLIGTFFNQTLPSSIGGDAVRLWLVARGGAGWRAATYSIFVDRAIGLIALAIVIVASLPWSYRLIDDPHGRSALLFVDFVALAAGAGFLILGRLPWPWVKRWWATHHLHACSVIANRLIFSRERGPELAALSLLVHVLTAIIAWCVVRSIAAPVLFGQVFQLVPPVMLITMLPISCLFCSAAYPLSSVHSAAWYGSSAPKSERRAQHPSRSPSNKPFPAPSSRPCNLTELQRRHVVHSAKAFF